MNVAHRVFAALALAALVVLLAACAKAAPQPAGTTPSSPTPAAGNTVAAPVASPTEKPAPVDSAVPGDIPDTTQFVTHRSDAGQFTIKAPEGWAEQSGVTSVSYTGTVNSIAVAWMPTPAAPTTQSATSRDVAALGQSERGFQLGRVATVALPAGPAIEITYQANSSPNPVTGKQYRLDVVRYELWKSGTEAVITLSSPAGADNVDPWATVSKSFAWL
jgi:hypothetical protein